MRTTRVFMYAAAICALLLAAISLLLPFLRLAYDPPHNFDALAVAQDNGAYVLSGYPHYMLIFMMLTTMAVIAGRTARRFPEITAAGGAFLLVDFLATLLHNGISLFVKNGIWARLNRFSPRRLA